MNKHRVRRLFGALACICLVFFLTWFFTEFVGQRTEVEGMSMSPTLKDKENLILDKISYRFRDPKRYEIVVFPPKYKENTYYIKRIIGLSGENVRIDEDGFIYINGEKLQESYGKEVMRDPGLAKDGIQLGADEYFVLGDNRNDSMDSRMAEVGPIAGERIIGRAWLRIYPFDQIGFLKHGS